MSAHEWEPIESAPRDGTWFVALPVPRDGVGIGAYPPTVCRITGPRMNMRTEQMDEWDVQCQAMNCGSGMWAVEDFTHWMPLPEPPRLFDESSLPTAEDVRGILRP